MAGRLRGKVALITGAGSGIGAATAGLFAQEGAAVALADLGRESLEPVAAQVKSAGGEALAMAVDV
ncbi:MAG TPA: SDR family NAD(P)-dependent oxidoreductase, partial [Actinomycetota bacterium]|nr:SDR family NAD(P)-dependent oxidoreductase [Actinomycetota bacterium]